MDEKHLLMSSGGYGSSHIDILNIEADPIVKIKTIKIDSIYFGEGVTYLKDLDHIIMLTYMNRKVFRYNSKLELLEMMTIPSLIREGWGITHTNQNELIVSDGTSTLYFVDPKDFSITETISVIEGDRKVS